MICISTYLRQEWDERFDEVCVCFDRFDRDNAFGFSSYLALAFLDFSCRFIAQEDCSRGSMMTTTMMMIRE